MSQENENSGGGSVRRPMPHDVRAYEEQFGFFSELGREKQESIEKVELSEEQQRQDGIEFITSKLPKVKAQKPTRSPARTLREAVTDALLEQLDQTVPGDKKHRTYAQFIAAKLIRKAAIGDMKAFREIADRTAGKALSAFPFVEPPPPPEEPRQLDLSCLSWEQVLLWRLLVLEATYVPLDDRSLRMEINREKQKLRELLRERIEAKIYSAQHPCGTSSYGGRVIPPSMEVVLPPLGSELPPSVVCILCRRPTVPEAEDFYPVLDR